MSSTIKGQYVKDTAGVLWFAVIRDKGGASSQVKYYADVRCDPATLGTPAAGVLVPASDTGAQGGAADAATNTKLNEVITAINSTVEDDQTQGILNTLVTEANDTQTLITTLKAAVDSATDDVVATKLDSVLTAVQSTAEDDQTQVKLDSVIAAIGTEGDQTQTGISGLATSLTTLISQNLAESNETQGLLTAIRDRVGAAYTGVINSNTVAAGGVLTIATGFRNLVVHNTGTTPMSINGVSYPGGAYFARDSGADVVINNTSNGVAEVEYEGGL